MTFIEEFHAIASNITNKERLKNKSTSIQTRLLNLKRNVQILIVISSVVSGESHRNSQKCLLCKEKKIILKILNIKNNNDKTTWIKSS